MDPNTHRAEAERWLGIAMKLLTARDFLGSKTFAIRAKDSDPNNDMSDQILAVVETVLAGEKRVNSAQHPDWYSVLQLPRLVRDPDLIANHYRRLVMLLNPERNRLPFADYALQLVMDAWTVLSDPTKKWLFDNELAVYLQRLEQQHQPQPQQHHHQQQQQHQPQQQQQAVRVEAMRVEVVDHHQQQQQLSAAAAAAAVGVSSPVAVAAQSNSHINTFQFFQPQPPPQQSQQQQQQQTVSMWQQQQQHQHQQQQLELELLQNQNRNHHHHQQQQHSSNTNQLHQIEFMQPPPQQHQHPPPQQHQLLPQLLPQWQMRDPTPAKGGERNKGVLNGIGVGLGVTGTTTSTASATSSTPPVAVAAPAPVPIAQILTPTSQTMRQVADVAPRVTTVLTPTRTTPRPVPAPPQPPPPVPVAVPLPAREVVTAVTSVVDGNVKNVGINNVVVVSNSDANDGGVVHEDNSVVVNNNNDNAAADDDDENKVEEGEVESFWTSCPYCFYIFEYQKVYQDCTLRCQNCRRGFHAVQIPNPPPIRGTGDGDGDGDDKGKETSFCCWGFVPIGFSTAAWKKHNRMGKANVASNWVPFSPMFACPTGSGDGNFQWFESSEAAAVGPKNMGPPASRPRVYVDEDFEVFNSDPSDSDSSDQDWRRNPVHEKKKRKKRRGRVGAVGRPRKVKPQSLDVQNQANNNLITAGRVTVASHALEGVPTTRKDIVVGLTAGAKEDTRRKVTATLTKNQAKRRVKNMGRLDLNVEFNNDGDEHAPTVSAVNGAETGVENIEFFEGLDEFLSTLPILNVGGDEKPKPS